MKWNLYQAYAIKSQAEEELKKLKKAGWSAKITIRRAKRMWPVYTVWTDASTIMINRLKITDIRSIQNTKR